MVEKIKIDYERGKVSASMDGEEPRIILISEGKVRYFEMAAHGQFLAKTHEGKVVAWENTEKGRM